MIDAGSQGDAGKDLVGETGVRRIDAGVMVVAHEAAAARQSLSRRERIGQQLRLFDRQGEVAISLAICVRHNLGLDLRRDQVRRCAVGTAPKWMEIRWEPELFVVLAVAIDDPSMAWFCDRLAERLAVIADRPLTPKEILVALPITNRERLRWTKDYRLKRSGDMQIRPGQIVTIPTYSVSATEEIRADQAILDRWREADRHPDV